MMEAEQGLELTTMTLRPGSHRLTEGVLFSRRFVPSYNVALLCLLLIWALYYRFISVERRIVHNGFSRVESLYKRWFNKKSEELPYVEREQQNLPSSIEDTKRRGFLDEASPLLQHETDTRRKTTIVRQIRAFLMYQPERVPIINRPLPSNAVSILVLLLTILNTFYLFFQVPMDLRYAFILADRAGLLFVVNLPFLYLLSAKNQPLKSLLGHSHESLNIFHRRLGELLIFMAAIHLIGMIYVWYSILRPVGFGFLRFITTKIILLGLFAFAAYNLIYLTSLRSFRRRCYEVFLFLHVSLQTVALVLLWFHHSSGRPYIAAALFIFLADRLVMRIYRTATIPASITLMEDGSTVLISANWSITPTPTKPSFLPKTIRQGWHAGDHVFISVPSLSALSRFQAHPFTIASAAPLSSHSKLSSASSTTPHAWFSLIIRSRSGFTSQLRDFAASAPSKYLNIRLDGPYGSGSAQRMLQRSDVALVIAGGSGIAVAFPLLSALLLDQHSNVSDVSDRSDSPNAGKGPKMIKDASHENPIVPLKERRPRSVALLWVIHSAAHRNWVPDERLRELQARGLQVFIPSPTEKAGRPDVAAFVREYVTGEGHASGVGAGVLATHSTTDAANATYSSSGKSSGSSGSSSRSSSNTYAPSSPSTSTYSSHAPLKQPTDPSCRRRNRISVVVSGPQAMNREVRNTCSELVGTEKLDVDVAVEQFEW